MVGKASSKQTIVPREGDSWTKHGYSRQVFWELPSAPLQAFGGIRAQNLKTQFGAGLDCETKAKDKVAETDSGVMENPAGWQ